MARPLRLELSGGIYHVTARGDGRDDIYLETLFSPTIPNPVPPKLRGF